MSLERHNNYGERVALRKLFLFSHEKSQQRENEHHEQLVDQREYLEFELAGLGGVGFGGRYKLERSCGAETAGLASTGPEPILVKPVPLPGASEAYRAVGKCLDGTEAGLCRNRLEDGSERSRRKNSIALTYFGGENRMRILELSKDGFFSGGQGRIQSDKNVTVFGAINRLQEIHPVGQTDARGRGISGFP